MPRYVRPRIPAATIFFTLNLANRRSDLLVQEIDKLRDAFTKTLNDRIFTINAIVILPDHLHTVITLPDGDDDYATRWRIIKSRFSRQISCGHRRASHLCRKERGIWQRRYWEHHIRSKEDFRAHVEYCWKNPVKHGYVEKPADWPYSSIHRDIRLGRVPENWQ